MQTPDPQQRLSVLNLDSFLGLFLGSLLVGKKHQNELNRNVNLFYLVTLDEVNLLDEGSWFFGNKSRK